MTFNGHQRKTNLFTEVEVLILDRGTSRIASSTTARCFFYLVEAKMKNSILASSLFGLKISNLSKVVVTNHILFIRIPQAIYNGISEMSDVRNKGQCLKVDFTP